MKTHTDTQSFEPLFFHFFVPCFPPVSDPECVGKTHRTNTKTPRVWTTYKLQKSLRVLLYLDESQPQKSKSVCPIKISVVTQWPHITPFFLKVIVVILPFGVFNQCAH